LEACGSRCSCVGRGRSSAGSGSTHRVGNDSSRSCTESSSGGCGCCQCSSAPHGGTCCQGQRQTLAPSRRPFMATGQQGGRGGRRGVAYRKLLYAVVPCDTCAAHHAQA
jgi:hypothetical protein